MFTHHCLLCCSFVVLIATSELIGCLKLAELPMPWHLDIVGDGPKRHLFENQAKMFFGNNSICFHGRLDEDAKLNCLAHANALVLPLIVATKPWYCSVGGHGSRLTCFGFSACSPGMGWVVNLVSSLVLTTVRTCRCLVICNLILLSAPYSDVTQ